MSPQAHIFRAAALVSGGGTTACNLIDKGRQGEIPALVELVIAHRGDIPAIERCRAKGVDVVVIEGPASSAQSDEIDRLLRDRGIELVLLAGYLRPFRVGPWTGRVLNIHPALLPNFGGKGMFGLRVHQAVIESGQTESGCTVHHVDDQYDHGAVLVQMRVPVESDDTPEALAKRVFATECVAYPQAIRLWASHMNSSHLRPNPAES